MRYSVIPLASLLLIVSPMATSCFPIQRQCQPVKKVEIAPEVGLTNGVIAAVKAPVSVEFAEVKGADACVLQDLQKGIYKDFEKVKKGEIPWGEYNRNRKEALSLISDLQRATAPPKSRPGNTLTPSKEATVAKIRKHNSKLRY